MKDRETTRRRGRLLGLAVCIAAMAVSAAPATAGKEDSERCGQNDGSVQINLLRCNNLDIRIGF